MSEAVTPLIRIYYVPQTFPCGPNSSCCGPVGQSQEELQHYRAAVEQAIPGIAVEVVNADKARGGKLDLHRDLPVIKLLNSFGYAACPIFTVNGEVVSIGTPVLEELVALLKEKLLATRTAGPLPQS